VHARLPGVVIDRHQGRKHFFLKKEAKTFCDVARAARQRQALMEKSFLVLFFKKERLAFYGFTPSSVAQSCVNLKSGRY